MMFEKYLRGSLGSIIDYLTSFIFKYGTSDMPSLSKPFQISSLLTP